MIPFIRNSFNFVINAMKNKLILLITILVFISGILVAQDYTTLKTASKKTLQAYNEATKQIMLDNYSQAILSMEALTSKEPRFIDGWLLLGELYKEAGNYDMAKQSLEKVAEIDATYSSKGYFFLAQVSWQLDSFKNCIEACEQYLSFTDISKQRKTQAEQLRSNAMFAIEAIKQPVPFDPVNLGEAINSDAPEYLPSLTGDEQVMVFTRRIGNGRNQQEDFYWSEKQDSNWTYARPLSDINSPYNEGAQTITPDGRTIYFVVCDKPGGYGGCDIYTSTKRGQKWSEPLNVGAPVCSNAWETQPSVSADGSTLFFCSTRPGGKGGSDIWVTMKDKSGKWSNPVNAGDSINTILDEKTAFIHPDGKTLYFSSPGHPGMGQDDIFYSRKGKDGNWGKPVNLGYPINTKNDENSFIVSLNGKHAYFSSDRIETTHGMDLYSFELYPTARPQQVIYVSGKVTDASTGEPVFASVEFIDLESGKISGKTNSDKIDGSYLISIPTGLNYALNIAANGYLFHSENFSLAHSIPEQPYNINVSLKPIKTGSTVVLKNIFFESNSYVLKSSSIAEIEILIALLHQHPALKIQINGHTDNIGNDVNNQLLSENRAKAVYNYLLQLGIVATRISYKGYGETRPIASNDTEEGRAQNRRTEFTVTGN